MKLISGELARRTVSLKIFRVPVEISIFSSANDLNFAGLIFLGDNTAETSLTLSGCKNGEMYFHYGIQKKEVTNGKLFIE